MILRPQARTYPDELEDAYGDSPYIKEISVVGIPAGEGAETVAAMVVPEYDHEGKDRETVREEVRAHLRNVSMQLPLYKRLKVIHLWDLERPAPDGLRRSSAARWSPSSSAWSAPPGPEAELKRRPQAPPPAPSGCAT
jgi:acyl-CoA synthetase (AMP-forming)/AMP-acid ligase II